MGDVQGWITIGTRLNSKQLEKQLRQQKSELAKYAKEEERMVAQREKNKAKIERAEEEKNLADARRVEKKKRAKFESDPTTRKYKLKEAERDFANEMSKIDEKYGSAYQLEEQLGQNLEVNRQKQQMLRNEIDETSNSLRRMNAEADFENSAKKIGKVVKQASRWALAIVGIRGLYSGIRQAINKVGQYNEQIKADMEYMGYALAMLLEPVVKKIVEWCKNLMYYIDYIAQAWFNLSGSIWKSSQSFLEANKNANKLKKTMLGFDEINKLGDNNNQTAPSFSLPDMGEMGIPKIVEDIAKNKDIILSFLAGVAGGLTAIKLGLDLIEASGVFMIVAGTVLLIEKLIEYFDALDVSLENNGTTWNMLGDILLAISIILGGIAVVIMSAPVAIAGVIVAIVAMLVAFWDKISALWTKGRNWLRESVQKMVDDGQWGLALLLEIVMNVVDAIFELFNGVFKGLKQIVDGILLMCKGQLGEGLKLIFKGIANMIIGILNALGSALNAVISPVRALIVAYGKVTGENWTMENIKIPKINYLATGGIVDMPKTGVAIGANTVAGEAGREGVLPLTNAQTMSELGKEIGKWITLNLDITNTIDGRILNKRLESIKNNNSFMRNGV